MNKYLMFFLLSFSTFGISQFGNALVCNYQDLSFANTVTPSQAFQIDSMERVFELPSENDRSVRCTNLGFLDATLQQVLSSNGDNPLNDCADIFKNKIADLRTIDDCNNVSTTSSSSSSFSSSSSSSSSSEGVTNEGYKRICLESNKDKRAPTSPGQKANIDQMESLWKEKGQDGEYTCDDVEALWKKYTPLVDNWRKHTPNVGPFDGCGPEYAAKMNEIYKNNHCNFEIVRPQETEATKARKEERAKKQKQQAHHKKK